MSATFIILSVIAGALLLTILVLVVLVAIRDNNSSSSAMLNSTSAEDSLTTLQAVDPLTSGNESGFVNVLSKSFTTPNVKQQLIAQFSAFTSLLYLEAKGGPLGAGTLSFELGRISIRALLDGVQLSNIVSLDQLTRVVESNGLTEDDIVFQLEDRGSVKGFTFIQSDLPAGVHTVDIEARLESVNATNTLADLRAVIGQRSLTLLS